MVAILCLELVFIPMFVIINEIHLFSFWSYFVMFGLGMLNNSIATFINVVLGFEFESKIVPFGAKSFIENVAVFSVVAFISIFDIQGKDQFRSFFILYFIIAMSSTILMF